MRKSIHSDEYSLVCAVLVKLRREKGLTQRALALLLGRENSFVWRIEHGERRLDVVEFFWVCSVLGYSAEKIYAELCHAFHEAERLYRQEHPAQAAEPSRPAYPK